MEEERAATLPLFLPVGDDPECCTSCVGSRKQSPDHFPTLPSTGPAGAGRKLVFNRDCCRFSNTEESRACRAVKKTGKFRCTNGRCSCKFFSALGLATVVSRRQPGREKDHGA